MPERLRIALIAHDTKKDALAAWAKRWEHWLAGHTLLGTGSSAAAVERACPSLQVERLKSGPEGGDMQVGARIVLVHASWRDWWTRWCSSPIQ